MSAWPWNLLILPHTPSPRSRWSNRRKENPTKGLVVASWEMKKRLGTVSQEVECALTRQPASVSNSHRQKSWAQESRDGNGSSSSHHYTQYPTHRISDFKPITWVLLVRRTEFQAGDTTMISLNWKLRLAPPFWTPDDPESKGKER